MPDKCVKKKCPPHADGRTRACNPETGRCKLVAKPAAKTNVKPKTAPKTSVKPKTNGTHPMTKKEIVAYLESSGAYAELDDFREIHADLLDGGHAGFGHVLSKWMKKYGATHVSQKLLKKLLVTPGKKVKLVVFDFDDDAGVDDRGLYQKALSGSFEDLVVTRLKGTDNAEAAINEAAHFGGGWDGHPTDWRAYDWGNEHRHPARKGPASDLVRITSDQLQEATGLEFFALVWLKAKPASKWETEIGRYNMVFTWLK